MAEEQTVMQCSFCCIVVHVQYTPHYSTLCSRASVAGRTLSAPLATHCRIQGWREGGGAVIEGASCSPWSQPGGSKLSRMNPEAAAGWDWTSSLRRFGDVGLLGSSTLETWHARRRVSILGCTSPPLTTHAPRGSFNIIGVLHPTGAEFEKPERARVRPGGSLSHGATGVIPPNRGQKSPVSKVHPSTIAYTKC